jgi:hypothetical protein
MLFADPMDLHHICCKSIVLANHVLHQGAEALPNPEAPQKSDPNFDKYPDTILVFDDGLRIDLTRDLTPDHREKLHAKFHGPFAVLTGADPFGRVASDAENESSRRSLEQALRSICGNVMRVRGNALDGGHSEESFACDATLDEAARIAREYRQSAFFWYDGQEFSLVESEGTSRASFLQIRLPKKEAHGQA